jgi:2-dehydro-3-deoxyphosphogluconate aldolase/(4S)-4-hydroxy-2-oxoglutarate aldolase
VVRKARELALAVLPGVMTPSEIMTAQAAGLSCLKLFPAELAGGVNFLKAVAGPMAGIKFCPTGGIHPGNASEYLALPNVACIGGSWIAPADLIASESWQQIEQLTRQALQAR